MSRPLQPGSLPNIRAKLHGGPLEVRYESFALIKVLLILLFQDCTIWVHRNQEPTRLDFCYQANLQKHATGIQVIHFFNFQKCCNNLRDEYLICEFSCVLSSVGGYVGLFFGVSVLDFVFLGEWVVGKFTKVIQKYNKNIWSNKPLTLRLQFCSFCFSPVCNADRLGLARATIFSFSLKPWASLVQTFHKHQQKLWNTEAQYLLRFVWKVSSSI